jgi:hypothetical protein
MPLLLPAIGLVARASGPPLSPAPNLAPRGVAGSTNSLEKVPFPIPSPKTARCCCVRFEGDGEVRACAGEGGARGMLSKTRVKDSQIWQHG